MHLNREAGRSFKDLSQYPVMPWVLADYTSPTLDLADPAVYRDLSRPIGALNPRRLADFQQRFAELKQMAAPAGRQAPGAPPPLDTPPFLYGCHYSSPGYVVFYLMRSNPELMLRLQARRAGASTACWGGGTGCCRRDGRQAA
jgi:factor associated with neutral sphingomyelinase activation